MTDHPLIVFFLSILFGLATGMMAQKKGYRPPFWFVIGLCFGVFGFLVLCFLPKKEMVPIAPPVMPEPPCDMGLWYFLDETHTQHGPVEFSALMELWREKKLTAASYLWQEGMLEWKRVSELPLVQARLG
jgi:MFS family permease